MSRIGRKLIHPVKGVNIEQSGPSIKVTGPKGTLSAVVPPSIGIEVKEGEVRVSRSSDDKAQTALHGTSRADVNNIVKDVSEGFQRKLEIVGVGYKAEVKGKKIQLSLG